MMRFIIYALLTLTLSSSVFAQNISVMSYNLKYDNPDDKENNWNRRKDQLIGLIRFHSPDIIGVQEALHHQLEDIISALPEYTYTGVGRDDGKEKGEYSAIIYRKDKFTIQDHGTFWLSPTPNKVSKAWDAALPRICTWAVFKSESGQVINAYNTHFDHIGVVARKESAELIVEKIKNAEGPVILTGDFNSTPDSDPYQILSHEYHDARLISKMPAYGPEETFNGFEFTKIPQTRIDYIFVNDYWVVERFATFTDSWSMHYPSDHFPIYTELVQK